MEIGKLIILICAGLNLFLALVWFVLESFTDLSPRKNKKKRKGKIMIVKKTALIGNEDPRSFINDLNKCLADKKVIDVKYQTLVLPTEAKHGYGITDVKVCDRALVIYEEEIDD